MNDILEVGAIVRRADQPGWGLGQVQSIIGERITVNFEHVGKVALNGAEVALTLISLDRL